MQDVHTAHCCKYHGCKYGHDDCTVTTGVAPAEYLCETCDWEINNIDNHVMSLFSRLTLIQELGRLDEKYEPLLVELCLMTLK